MRMPQDGANFGTGTLAEPRGIIEQSAMASFHLRRLGLAAIARAEGEISGGVLSGEAP
jgi:hypothetical protein